MPPPSQPFATLETDRSYSIDQAPHDAMAPQFPRPARRVVDGVPILVMLPAPAMAPARPDGPAEAEPGADQPLLPLLFAEGELDGGRTQLVAATAHVARLARAVAEVLGRRRPVAQLRGVLDDDSLTALVAWARLGTVRPERLDPPRLETTNPDRIDGWVGLRSRGRLLALVVTLQREGGTWRCTAMRLLAPPALAASATASATASTTASDRRRPAS